MPLASITTYCSLDDVQKRLSAEGVRLRLDDDPTSITDVLENAAMEVNQRAQRIYTVARLATSNWIKFKARDIAVYYACIRRNNPVTKGVQFLYDAAIEALERVMNGQLRIPDIADGKGLVPVLSNQLVRPYPVPHPATVVNTSTGTAAGYSQNTDTQDNLDYSV